MNNLTLQECDVTEFIGCHFTNGAGTGCKFIKSNNSKILISGGCYFDYLTGQDYGIDLSGFSKISDCHLMVRIVADNVLGVKLHGNAKAHDNSIMDVMPTTIAVTTGTCFRLEDNAEAINNFISGFTTPYNINTNNNVIIKKSDKLNFLSNSDMIQLYNTGTLDCGKFVSNFIGFNESQDLYINKIIGLGNGEKVTLFNSSLYTIYLISDTYQAFTGCIFNGKNSPLAISSNGSVELINLGWAVKVLYYNAFQQPQEIYDSIYPTSGQPKSWVCKVSRTPGTWVSEGNL